MKKNLILLLALCIGAAISFGQKVASESIEFRKSLGAWSYKGFFGITPLYAANMNPATLALGFGTEGEFALPRILSLRAGYFRNYFELDKTAKKGYIFDYGLNFHPIEWISDGTFSNYEGSQSSYTKHDEGKQSEHIHEKTRAMYSYFSDKCIKRINLRAGMLDYRFNWEDTRNFDMDYVQSKGTYLGLSFYKISLDCGARREIGADVVFQKSVEVPMQMSGIDTCSMRTGFRAYYNRFGDVGGGTFELGLLPGINRDFYYYLKVTLSFRAPFIRGYKIF